MFYQSVISSSFFLNLFLFRTYVCTFKYKNVLKKEKVKYNFKLEAIVAINETINLH